MSGTWTLRARVANESTTRSCAMDGILRLQGTLDNFRGNATYTLTVVVDGMATTTEFSHAVRGGPHPEFGRASRAGGFLVVPGYGGPDQRWLTMSDMNVNLMWGPWTCPATSLPGNWFVYRGGWGVTG